MDRFGYSEAQYSYAPPVGSTSAYQQGQSQSAQLPLSSILEKLRDTTTTPQTTAPVNPYGSGTEPQPAQYGGYHPSLVEPPPPPPPPTSYSDYRGAQRESSDTGTARGWENDPYKEATSRFSSAIPDTPQTMRGDGRAAPASGYGSASENVYGSRAVPNASQAPPVRNSYGGDPYSTSRYSGDTATAPAQDTYSANQYGSGRYSGDTARAPARDAYSADPYGNSRYAGDTGRTPVQDSYGEDPYSRTSTDATRAPAQDSYGEDQYGSRMSRDAARPPVHDSYGEDPYSRTSRDSGRAPYGNDSFNRTRDAGRPSYGEDAYGSRNVRGSGTASVHDSYGEDSYGSRFSRDTGRPPQRGSYGAGSYGGRPSRDTSITPSRGSYGEDPYNSNTRDTGREDPYSSRTSTGTKPAYHDSASFQDFFDGIIEDTIQRAAERTGYDLEPLMKELEALFGQRACDLCGLSMSRREDVETHYTSVQHEKKFDNLIQTRLGAPGDSKNTEIESANGGNSEASAPTTNTGPTSSYCAACSVDVEAVDKMKHEESEAHIAADKLRKDRLNGFYCGVCMVHLLQTEKKEHISSEAHKTSVETFKSGDFGFFCDLCQIAFFDAKKKKMHLRSITHKMLAGYTKPPSRAPPPQQRNRGRPFQNNARRWPY